MKRSVTLIFALFASVAVFSQERPTADKCLTDVMLWDNQLTDHVRSITEARTQEFSTEAGRIPAYVWLGRQEEIADCVDLYRDDNAKYESVIRRIDLLLSLRYLNFILDTKQGSRYKKWEDAQKSMQRMCGGAIVN